MELQYLTDVRGKKKAVIVPIEQYNSLIESQKRLKELEEVDLSQKKKDPAKMSRKDFFAMIDKRRKSKSIKMSMEDMQDLLVIMQRENSPTSPFSEALERIKKYREKNNL